MMNKSFTAGKTNLRSTSMYRTQALPMLIPDQNFKPRKWKMGLRDKLDNKEKYLNSDLKRQEKIDRTIIKQRVKSRIGIRLNQYNKQLLDQMRAGVATGPFGNYSRPSCKDSVQEKYSDRFGITSVDTQNSFPKSTMQESFTSDVFKHHRVDKFNFKKLSSFGAYCNAQNGNGVFINPPATGL